MFHVQSSTFRTQAPELLQTDLGCVCLCVSCVTAAVGVDGGIRNVRAARGCSAVLSSSAVRLRWRANAVRGKIEIDPLQATAGQQSLVQTPVCEESQFSV